MPSLSEHGLIMKPFPRRKLNKEERKFNCTLNRASRVVENAFVIYYSLTDGDVPFQKMSWIVHVVHWNFTPWYYDQICCVCFLFLSICLYVLWILEHGFPAEVERVLFFIFFFIIFLSFDFFITLNNSLWCSNPILSQWINNKSITNIWHIFVFSFNQNHTYLVLSQRVYILLIRLASIERKMTVWPICDYLLVHCNVGKIFHMHFVWFHTKVANLPLQWNLRSNLIQN